MEHASGQDLGWFFSEWLTRTGEPTIDGSWRYDAAAKQVIVTIRQTQTSDPFRFQLGVGVAQSAGSIPRVVNAEVIGRETTISIPADAAPASVVFDPNVALLADIHQPAGG
jgi:aminopeptidase N